ncbi:DUF4395 domain-containing protein [Nocardioides euryhalodurans]|uniref:DUF4395 domain-containing protein n=1 Tax=Nocardioides euryhalodurans TaxID=2518370 RepID=A0A4P7GMI8_9ACTN|nr:DUF4395 domain-containing protein [Nocardioides euryhalodurans]QBR93378.1 DUF4395 domain-containing protein [Nocardioides euryhalodurans]
MSTLTSEQRHDVASARIDARGPQFTAAVTAVLLIAVLSLPPAAATVLIGVQAVLFAIGAFLGVQHTPTAWLFRRVVRPRLSGTTEFEDPRPPRFAQAVGLGFALVAFAGFASGVVVLGLVATGFALVAALLNALFRFCLGCEAYLLIKRVTTRSTTVTT